MPLRSTFSKHSSGRENIWKGIMLLSSKFCVLRKVGVSNARRWIEPFTSFSLIRFSRIF